MKYPYKFNFLQLRRWLVPNKHAVDGPMSGKKRFANQIGTMHI